MSFRVILFLNTFVFALDSNIESAGSFAWRVTDQSRHNTVTRFLVTLVEPFKGDTHRQVVGIDLIGIGTLGRDSRLGQTWELRLPLNCRSVRILDNVACLGKT